MTDTIWTSAHHTQFMSPGWRLLQGGSSGMLPGGGSYVAAVSPSKADFTLVLETMQGNCLRCSGGKTQAQTLTFALTNGLPGPGAVLKQWQTVQGASFVAQPDVTVAADGTITVSVPADGMVTVSTITTASHGSFPGSPIPADTPFPFPYADAFDDANYVYDQLPRYFGDQAGSFAVRHGVVQQVVPADPGPNGWGGNRQPYSLLGDKWADLFVAVDAAFDGGFPDRGDGAPPAPVRERERNQLASAVPCNASSANQRWDVGAISPKYFSLAGDSGGVCLDNPGCGGDGTQIDYWPCVTSGGACNDDGLRWDISAATKLLTTPSTPGCAVLFADGSIKITNPCAGGVGSEWAYDPASKHVMCTNPPGGGAARCLTAVPAPPPPPPPSSTPYVSVASRVPNYNGANQGYSLILFVDGSWQLTSGESALLSNGSLPQPFNSSAWHRLQVSAKGTDISASIDGAVVATATDGAYSSGQVAIGSNYHRATFDNFALGPPA